MDIRVLIVAFYWCCMLLGVLHFTYNQRSRRVKLSKTLQVISKLWYSLIAVISGYLSCLLFLKGGYWLVSTRVSNDFLAKSFLAQDELIEYMDYTLKYIGIFINVFIFLKHHHLTQLATNNLLAIFNHVRLKGETTILVHSHLQYLVFIKLLFGTYRFVRFTLKNLYYLMELNDITSIFGEYLRQVYSWSHLFAYLALISFYVNANKFFECFAIRDHCLKRYERIQNIVKISYQIHRTKKIIERIYSPFLVLLYLGLFNDIINLFSILKEVLYKDYIVGHAESKMTKVTSLLLGLPDGMSSTFEIYMIGCISDALEGAEKLLENKIVLFETRHTSSKKPIEKDMEMLLIYAKVHELSISAYRMFKINQGFAFDCLLNVVVLNVIFCLHYFAQESVYSKAVGFGLTSNYTKFAINVGYHV